MDGFWAGVIVGFTFAAIGFAGGFLFGIICHHENVVSRATKYGAGAYDPKTGTFKFKGEPGCPL